MAGFGVLPAELPSEVASILPSDPFAQLDLAHKIATHALTSKVAQLEADAQQLREAMLNKQNHIKGLERRISTLELELQDMQAKNKAAVEEGHRLQNEKGALADMVKKLHREVAKLESFKKNLLQHLHEEDEPRLEPMVTAADMSGERLISEVLNSVSKPQLGQLGAAGQHTTASVYARGPTSTPGFPSTSGRPSYAATPQRPIPTAQAPAAQPGAAYAHPSTGSPRIDGKEFFRLARAQLSYEQFSQFLHNIKELNGGRQSREETLRRSREIFGPAHQDLYGMFEALLSRHVSGF